MQRISRKLSFFRRNHHMIFGCLWISMAALYLLFSDWDDIQPTFEILIGFGYLIISILYFYQAYQNRGDLGEYIEWNEDILRFKPNLGKVQTFKLGNLIKLTVAENNFIIKAPNAQGTMAPLKGYSKEDIIKLREAFQKD